MASSSDSVMVATRSRSAQPSSRIASPTGTAWTTSSQVSGARRWGTARSGWPAPRSGDRGSRPCARRSELHHEIVAHSPLYAGAIVPTIRGSWTASSPTSPPLAQPAPRMGLVSRIAGRPKGARRPSATPIPILPIASRVRPGGSCSPSTSGTSDTDSPHSDSTDLQAPQYTCSTHTTTCVVLWTAEFGSQWRTFAVCEAARGSLRCAASPPSRHRARSSTGRAIPAT